VHIEVTHSLSSDSFLMALHRFIARRGKPQKLFSDNGTNFVAADRELAQEIREINGKKLRGELLMEAIEWSFNPPHAPHMGGVWERLVRSVKQILRHLVGTRLLNDEELTSFMCEAEKIMNDRPLTRLGSDPRDETPLTPNHLLLLRRGDSTPLTEANHVRRRWQVIQQIANHFYERFVSEYVPQLQLRSKWATKKENLRVSDIVLVAEEDTPRGQWPLGIVEELEHSADGLVRAAKVRSGGKVKRRPIARLVLLERHD
jgi:transposase InsO family protein